MKNLNSYLKESLNIQEAKTIVNIKDIEEFLDKYYKFKRPYTIDQEGGEYVVNTKGDVSFGVRETYPTLTNGKFRFGIVKGDFECNGNEDGTGLTSLEGAPERCVNFYCAGNPIKTLEGAPKIVDDTFSCFRCNELKDLIGAPEVVTGQFMCSGCKNLKSLEGAPKKVEMFSCNDCPNLETLKGAPQAVGTFDCQNCPKIKDFNGLPSRINKHLNIKGCTGLKGKKVPSIKGEVES